MKIFKEFEFEAAHHLPLTPKQHKCHRVHGHNYRVQLLCEGPVDPLTGWLVDFAVLDNFAETIRAKVDHQCLNDVSGLQNPTAERIAEWVIARAPVPISQVTVWENSTCGAIAEQPEKTK